LLAEGLSQAEIARRLGLATATVNYHAFRMREPPQPPEVLPAPESARSTVRTRDAVGARLAAGESKLAIARALGLSKSTVSYHARRLGAPVDERGARRYDWEAIQRYYDLGNSVEQCQRAFGFAKQTWHVAMKRGAIVTRPHAMPIDELCVNGVPRGRGNLRQRLIAAGLLQPLCAECGLSEWRGSPAPLALHHVNGDRHDNRLENLQLLCANCHCLTDSFAGRRRPRAA